MLIKCHLEAFKKEPVLVVVFFNLAYLSSASNPNESKLSSGLKSMLVDVLREARLPDPACQTSVLIFNGLFVYSSRDENAYPE